MSKKKAAQIKKWRSEELKARIQRKHPIGKGWFTVTEMSPASGMGSSAGRMDAVAVCLYGGRGFAVHGFEVKVSRSDWLAELNNPSKNSIAQEEVDFWWLVVPDSKVATVEELPPKWGMMTCSGKGLRLAKQAERLKEEIGQFGRPFVVSLLWRAGNFDTPGEKALRDAHKAGREEGLKECRKQEQQFIGFDDREFKRLRRVVDEFEERSGTNIEYGDPGQIGDLLRALGHGGSRSALRRDMVDAQHNALRLQATMDKAIKEFDALSPVTIHKESC